MSDFTVPTDVTTAAGAEVLRRMDDLAADPALAASVAVVRRPVAVLQDILREAGDVLRGDPLAVERLRLLLVLAAPFARVLTGLDAADILRDQGAVKTVESAKDVKLEGNFAAVAQPDHGPRELALCALQIRPLLTIAVAAVRAAPGPTVAFAFLQRLLGLALATAPIEALARLDPFDPRDELIREVLRRSVTAGGDIDVAAFAADPDELGRWRTLIRLLATGFIRRLATRWDSAQWQGARTIRVDRILADNTEGVPRLTLLGAFPIGPAPDEEELDDRGDDEPAADGPSESNGDDQPNEDDDDPSTEDGAIIVAAPPSDAPPPPEKPAPTEQPGPPGDPPTNPDEPANAPAVEDGAITSDDPDKPLLNSDGQPIAQPTLDSDGQPTEQPDPNDNPEDPPSEPEDNPDELPNENPDELPNENPDELPNENPDEFDDIGNNPDELDDVPDDNPDETDDDNPDETETPDELDDDAPPPRPELQPRELSIALVAPGHEPEPVTIFAWSSDQVEVSRPVGSLGWFAALDELRDARWKRYFADLLASLDEFLPGRDVPFGPERPSEWFAAMPQPVTPLRSPGATFAGGEPGVVITPASETGELGDRVTVRYDSIGATHVRRDDSDRLLPPRGELPLELTTPPAATLTLTPVLLTREGVRLGAPGTIRVEIAEQRPEFGPAEIRQRGGPLRLEDRPVDVTVRLTRPLDGAVFTLRLGETTLEPHTASSESADFTIPRDRVRTGLAFTVAVASPRRDGEVTRDHGPFRLAAPRKVAVVLVRPAVVEAGYPPRIDAVDPAALAAALADVELAQDLAITARELPYRSDAVATLAKQPTGEADPVLGNLIDGLASAAAESPGAEDSLWLAVVPGPGKWTTVTHAEAALAIGVAPLAGLGAAIRGAFPAKLPALAPARPRLRILGLARGDDDIDIADVRREREPRRAGPGAPIVTGFTAVCRDDGGNTIAVHPLRAHRPGGSFVALFEATPDLRSVVIKGPRGPGVEVVQPESTPVFTATLDGFHASWTYTHGDGMAPQILVEAGRDGLFAPVATLDACFNDAELPRNRLTAGDAIRLVASDGWNAAAVDLPAVGATDPPIALRRVHDRLFWADAPPGSTVAWTLGDTPLGALPVLALPPATTGLLRLTATAPDAEASVVLTRRLGARP